MVMVTESAALWLFLACYIDEKPLINLLYPHHLALIELLLEEVLQHMKGTPCPWVTGLEHKEKRRKTQVKRERLGGANKDDTYEEKDNRLKRK